MHLFLNFCYFPSHFFFAVPPHSPATLLLPSEVSKEAEGRSANPAGQPTLFSSPLWKRPGAAIPPCLDQSAIEQKQTDKQIHTQKKGGKRLFAL